VVTGSGEADSVAVTGEQYRTDLVFQLFDASRNAVTSHAQPACRGPKTAGASHFKKDANALPVRSSAIADMLVLNFVSTDSRI